MWGLLYERGVDPIGAQLAEFGLTQSVPREKLKAKRFHIEAVPFIRESPLALPQRFLKYDDGSRLFALTLDYREI